MAHRDDTRARAGMPLSSGVDAGPCVAVVVDPELAAVFASYGVDCTSVRTIVQPSNPTVTNYDGMPLFYAGPLISAEDADMETLVAPLRVADQSGLSAVVLCGMVQTIDESLKPGDLVVILDHINLLGDSPLVGKRDEDGLVAFVNMAAAYAPKLVRSIRELSGELNLPLREGVLVVCRKDQLSGADAVNFGANCWGDTFAPQTIEAASLGIPVVAVAIVRARLGVQADDEIHLRASVRVQEAAGSLARLVAAWARRFGLMCDLELNSELRVNHAEACLCI